MTSGPSASAIVCAICRPCCLIQLLPHDARNGQAEQRGNSVSDLPEGGIHRACKGETIGEGLEACGFAPRGEALKRAAHGCFSAGGCIPLSTFGGLKARGHPVGASGAYQIVEATAQLRREAGPNQVPGARVALTQSIGGHGSIAVTHVLEA